MSKVPYTKLGLTKNDKKELLKWGQVEIEIKQYLPFEDKLHLIERIVNKSLDDKGYIIAGEDCKTNVDGIFVAGDSRVKTLRQLVTATSDGAIAATNAIKYISRRNNV